MRVPACADVCTWARARDVAVLAAVAESEGSLFLAMQSAVEVMRDSDRLIGNAKGTGGRRSAWYAPHRAIVALGSLLLLVAVAGGTLGVVNSGQAEKSTALISDRYLILQPPVREIRASIADFQVLAEHVFVGSTPDSTVVTSAVADSNITDSNYLKLQRLLALSGNTTLAPHLSTRMASFVTARSKLGAFLAGEKVTPETAQIAAEEQKAYANLDAGLASLQAANTDRLLQTANQARGDSNAARLGLLWSLAIGVVFAIAVTTMFARKALRVEHESARKDAIQLALTRRNEFEARLQRALEMSKAEAPVFALVTEALNYAAPQLRAELLLADSSRAHFRQVLVSPADNDELGCGVVSPDDCPAASRGQSMVFPSSTAMDACPNLRGRGCSAVCVPVSISGNSVGVFHVTAPEGSPPGESIQRDVEVVARRASERLAMLRAFELSQTEANTDSLTGLLTRRSLEGGVRDLQDSGLQYSVAYGDLDHFKRLNDVFGHDAGDRALRTFSQVLRDSLRPADIPCRYGGEEFVIVLPGCGVPEAVQVLERVMQRIADRLSAGHHPNFTVSFGVASSDQAPDFAQVVALADEALLRAKSGGRNEIVIAGALGPARPDSAEQTAQAETAAPTVETPADLSEAQWHVLSAGRNNSD
jgi:diguanylate cyclase (GGDEF)-like protein